MILAFGLHIDLVRIVQYYVHILIKALGGKENKMRMV